MQNYLLAEMRENGHIIITFYISVRSIQISFYSFFIGQPDGEGHMQSSMSDGSDVIDKNSEIAKFFTSSNQPASQMKGSIPK